MKQINVKQMQAAIDSRIRAAISGMEAELEPLGYRLRAINQTTSSLAVYFDPVQPSRPAPPLSQVKLALRQARLNCPPSSSRAGVMRIPLREVFRACLGFKPRDVTRVLREHYINIVHQGPNSWVMIDDAFVKFAGVGVRRTPVR